jgi:hypothetical protein
LALKEAGHSSSKCVEALATEAARLPAELILLDASGNQASSMTRKWPHESKAIRLDPDLLVPQLWAVGLKEARGTILALTTSQCIPEQGWIASVLRVATEMNEATGFGGPIDGPVGGRPLDWAVYFSRYSAYMPPVLAGFTTEIPGDNAAYRRAAIERAWTSKDDGFWETLVHERLRRQNARLYMSPDIRVRLGPVENAWKFARARYRHGRHYGSTRRGMPLIRLLGTPALLPLLLARVARRIAAHREDWLPHYVRSLPWITIFLTMWSLGEARGYASPQRNQG